MYRAWLEARGERQEHHRHAWHMQMLLLLTLVALLLVTTGCQFKQSAFALTASNAGSTFAAAALTLSYAHEGKIGALLFAVILFVTCLGAALECVLALSYNVAQGFGWPWGEDKKPVEAAHFNLVIVIFLGIAFLIGLIGIDPLQLALFASTIISLFLPISLSPFLIIMNDQQYLGDKVNPRWMNIIVMAVLLIAFVISITSIPLELLSGGG